MEEHLASALAAWESFYVIAGSSAAALTGLMFVVLALVVDRKHPEASRGIASFGTPTVVHFSAAFLVAAILSAPWRTVAAPMTAAGILGVLGAGYLVTVVRRWKRQSYYLPVGEDWLWHAILPFLAYLVFAAAGLVPACRGESGLFAIAGGTLLLLICGLHNSWDAVTYMYEPPAAGASDGKPPASKP